MHDEKRNKKDNFFSKERLKYKENLDARSFQGFYKNNEAEDSQEESSPEKEIKKAVVLRKSFLHSINN